MTQLIQINQILAPIATDDDPGHANNCSMSMLIGEIF
jgi:hypothetical protein